MFYFTPLPGFFSPFPHGTSPLSVTRLYLALDDGPPGFLQDFSCLAVLRDTPNKVLLFRIRGYHSLWLLFPKYSTIIKLCNLFVLMQKNIEVPYNTLLSAPACY